MTEAWKDLYGKEQQPDLGIMENYIGSPLWQELRTYLEETYQVQPKVGYSSCSGQKGWNVKYQKSGKALCTLYPMDGYFIALVSAKDTQQMEVEALLPGWDGYLQQLYKNTRSFNGSKWLMIEVRTSSTLAGVKELIGLRVKQPAATKEKGK